MKTFLDNLAISDLIVKVSAGSIVVFLGIPGMFIFGFDWYFLSLAVSVSAFARYPLGFAMMPVGLFILWNKSLEDADKFLLSLIPQVLAILWGCLILGSWSIYVIQLTNEYFTNGYFYEVMDLMPLALGFGVAFFPIIFLNEYGRSPNDYLTQYNANTNNISFFITILLTMYFGIMKQQPFINCLLIFTLVQLIIGLPFSLMNKRLRDLYG